jgi:hypothetical protein
MDAPKRERIRGTKSLGWRRVPLAAAWCQLRTDDKLRDFVSDEGRHGRSSLPREEREALRLPHRAWANSGPAIVVGWNRPNPKDEELGPAPNGGQPCREADRPE